MPPIDDLGASLQANFQSLPVSHTAHTPSHKAPAEDEWWAQWRFVFQGRRKIFPFLLTLCSISVSTLGLLWCVPVDLQQWIMLEGLESTSAGTAAGLLHARSVTSAQSDKYRSEQICLNTAVGPKSWHSPVWGRFGFRSLDDFWFFSHDSLLGNCSGHFANANLDMLKHSHTLLTSSSGRDQG